MFTHAYIDNLIRNIKVCQDEAAAHYQYGRAYIDNGQDRRCIYHQEHQMFWASKARQGLYELLGYQQENQ